MLAIGDLTKMQEQDDYDQTQSTSSATGSLPNKIDELREAALMIAGTRDESGDIVLGICEEPRDQAADSLQPHDVLAYARKTGLSSSEVEEGWKEFFGLPHHRPGLITEETLNKVIREKCHITEYRHIPNHLWPRQSKVNSLGVMDFYEYLMWWNAVKFSEEVLVPDPRERILRRKAREHGLSFRDVEDIAGVFDMCDLDSNGVIDHEELKKLIVTVLRSSECEITPPVLQYYRRQLDLDGDGQITFHEFVMWCVRHNGVGNLSVPRQRK
eukprot:TRINITY_DN30272_c0_g1_i3.p1 TRINITY_DN30272_c0_g1~~TRINITY_DN30272_c0_g1_i3.p1  ORF type:complete len:270 (+),score=34.21 TRINITY_DN30272_c0_g1_i3:270-1079(+)